MGIQGNLKTVTMPNLLQWLTQEPLTGTLVLRRGKTEKRIMLRDGRILFTASNHPREYLTNYIRHVHWMRVNHPEILEVLKEYDQSPSVPLGRVLVERGVITKDELARIITAKVQDSLIDLFFWTEGGFEFIEGDIHYEGIVDITIDVQWVMMEGVRLMDELDRFRIVLSSPHLTFRVTDKFKQPDERTEEIARMIDAGATLAEMCEALYPTDYPTYKLFFEWHEKGWIELGPEKEVAGSKDASPPLSVGEVVLCRHCGMATPSNVPYCEMCGSELVADESGVSQQADAYHLIKGDLFAGRYEIQEIVSLGEVGTVYSAHDRKHQETVTLTAFPSLPSEDPVLLERLVAAGRSWRKLRHPNIVRVVDMGKSQGLFYLCLEQVESVRSLGEPSARKQFSETEEGMLRLATAVLEALTEAHSEGIVHAGLKAQNVLVDGQGHVRVTEFGIANAFVGLSLTQRAEFLGLPLYAAPETLDERREADARSDVYSVGVLLYQIATGDLPHVGETPESIREHRSRIDPPPPRQKRPDLPPYMERVILKALSKNPEARYENAGRMLADLQRGARGARLRRHARWAGVGLVAAAVALVVVYFTAIREKPPSLAEVGSLVQKGEAYLASEQYIFPEKENAFEVYRRVLRVDPKNEKARQGIQKIQDLFFERGERAVSDGELEAARIWLQKINIVDPDSDRTKKLVARIDEEQKRLEKEAQKAEGIRKLLASASDALAQVDLDPERTRKAFEYLKSVLGMDPSNAEAKKAWDGLLVRVRETAEKQVQAHSYAAAKESLVLIASLNPDDRALNARAEEVTRLADEQSARETRDRQIADLLDAAERYLALGQVLTPPGANAAESYRRALQVEPKNERGLKGLADIKKSYLAKADEAERIGNLYRAREALEAAQQAEVDPATTGATANRLAALKKEIAAQEEKQKRQETVETLLARAKRQVEAGDLVTPVGANALETYREALKVDAGNLTAEAGLDDVHAKLVAQGRRALESNRYAMAKEFFEKADSVRPGRAEIGALAKQAGQALTAQAEEESRKESVANLLEAGKRFLEAKQYFIPAGANAYESYSGVLKLDPENAEARAKLAEIGRVFRTKGDEALGQKSYTEAKLAYEYVLKVLPGDPQAKQKQAQIQDFLDRRGRVEELLQEADRLYRTRKYTQPADRSALWAYREVLKLDPGNREAADRIGTMKGMYVQLAQQSDGRGELPVSLDYLKKASSVDPDDQGLKPQIAELERRISADKEKALAAVRTAAPATAVVPVAAGAGTAGGEAASAQPPTPATQPVAGPASVAGAGRDTADDLVRRANEAFKQDRIIGEDGALRLLTRAAGLAPGDPRVRQDLARAREEVLARAKSERDRGDLAKALGTLTSANQTDPGYEPTRLALEEARREADDREKKGNRLGQIIGQASQSLRANDLDEATSRYQEALAVAPGNEEARRGLGDVKRAQVKLAEENVGKGDLEQARDRYAKALALDPSDSVIQGKISQLDAQIEEAKKKKQKEFRPAFSF